MNVPSGEPPCPHGDEQISGLCHASVIGIHDDLCLLHGHIIQFPHFRSEGPHCIDMGPGLKIVAIEYRFAGGRHGGQNIRMNHHIPGRGDNPDRDLQVFGEGF